MDNNNPNPTAGVPPVQQPQVTNVAPEPTPPSGGNNKMTWIVTGAVILVLILGGIYLYMNNRQTKPPAAESEPVSENVDSIEKELNTTSLDDLDREFSSVDTDLGTL